MPSFCKEEYQFVLGAKSLAYFPEVEGNYRKICQKSSDWPVYKSECDSNYLHFISDGTNYAFWIVSEKLTLNGSKPKMIKPVSINGLCPSSWGSPPWYIYEVNFFVYTNLILNH